MLITLAAAADAYTIPYETWMGAYVGERKMGYLNLRIDREDSGYHITSVLENRLTVLGADLTQHISTDVHTDANYFPIKENLTMTSGGRTTIVDALFDGDRIKCSVMAGAEKSEKIIPIPKGAALVGDALFVNLGKQPIIGKQYDLRYFNPLTLAIEELKIDVERTERIKIGDKTYDTVVLKNSTPMGDMTVWQEAGGEVVVVKAMMGIKMVRESKEQAMSGVGSGPAQDLAVLTRAKSDREIPNPRGVKRLDLMLDGLADPALIISDSQQRARAVPGVLGAVDYTITSATFNKADSISIPVSKSEFAAYIASTPYLDFDRGGVSDQARAVVGNEKNAYVACTKLRSWVHANMRSRGDIGITRSASDVLKSKEGVCRDYAILFAALARSRGIPTRIAAGLIYTQGAFYYHAWVECYVGKWMPFDATLPTDIVDATHIKLAEGDATAMFSLAKVIGGLQVCVKSFQ